MSSQTSVSPHSQGAQTPYHWLCLLVFHCNNHNCYFAFEPALGITVGLYARKGAIRRPLKDGFIIARSLEYPGCRRDRISTQGTAGKAGWYREGIARTSGETNFSGVHKDSCAARGQGARPLASPSNKAKKMACSAGPPARQLANFSREKIKIAHKTKKNSSPIHQGAVTSL